MAKRSQLFSKGLTTTINGKEVHVGKEFSCSHGYGYYCHVYYNSNIGYGFHKTNKFTAIKSALRDLGGDFVEEYIHHGRRVSVLKHLKGRHQQHCLCWESCARFKPSMPEKNCEIAQANFEFNIKHGVTTPIWECPKYFKNL